MSSQNISNFFKSTISSNHEIQNLIQTRIADDLQNANITNDKHHTNENKKDNINNHDNETEIKVLKNKIIELEKKMYSCKEIIET